MSVGRLCQREVDLAELAESVRDAAERMHQHSVGCLVVVNEAKQPIGIVTDRDLTVRVLAAGKDPYTTLVGHVMTPEPKVASQDTSIEAALSVMRAGAFRRLPIVARDGMLVGLLTLDDILMLLTEEFTQVGCLLLRETPRAAATLVPAR